jgi:hypothetical protein
MRNLIMLLAFAVCACNSPSEKATNAEEKNSAEHVDHHSGENVSPQIKADSSADNRLEVDTISSAKGAQEQK